MGVKKLWLRKTDFKLYLILGFMIRYGYENANIVYMLWKNQIVKWWKSSKNIFEKKIKLF